ncbi:hypothetical protein FXN80_10945 [Dickeya fangzhongdai]|uniref:hypothetical protein n=1 Tax=Dickeya fangzhongdai TaxID=1778540 RepID=UPI00136EA740|nr:hypothetical protein [Dickeya fangzhongdai]UMB78878.1 hypothetical protein FXN80_10945 [Dickeya fangzhongdai]
MVMLIFTLAGCEDKMEVFGIKIGNPLQSLRDEKIVKKEDLIPSKKHFLMVDLIRAPKNEIGDSAKYSVSSLDGEIISAYAVIDDHSEVYFNSLVGYAKNKLGEPIATNDGIKNADMTRLVPYGCVNDKTCPTAKYAIFRKGKINAMVSSGDGKSSIYFDSDKIKETMN